MSRRVILPLALERERERFGLICFSVCLLVWFGFISFGFVLVWLFARDLRKRRVGLDVIAYSAAISACEKSGEWQWALHTFHGSAILLGVPLFSSLARIFHLLK